MRVLVVLALAGCAAPPAAVPVGGPGALIASSTRLPAPAPIDPAVRGASYLSVVAGQLQPRWAAFLEDCRLRLPANHPLNGTALAVTFELAIEPTGALAGRAQIATSGNGDFDTAAADVLADASPLPVPPHELVSDDELVHVRWLFARDRRQAGAATARVVTVELPLGGVVDGMLGRGELARAARRVAAAPADPVRDAAAQRVMIAALREAMASPDGAARLAAVEASGRAGVHELAVVVRALLAATSDPALVRAAIDAVGALGDQAAVPALLAALREDLAQHAPLASARIAALAALGRSADAGAVVRSVLEMEPNPTALAALASAPVPELVGRLAGWASSGDPAVRRAVCAALPAAAPARAAGLIARGLDDADATVRALCADAAGRDREHRGSARLRELARDRDQAVRARAVAAIGALDPAHLVHAASDPAPEVRAAFAAAAGELELRGLVGDPAPEVRAAALAALITLGPARVEAMRAAGDPAAAVRWAAVAGIDDVAVLARLTGDDSPEVATAALVRRAQLAGRAQLTVELLGQLAMAPSGSIERVRIALAWLLAS